MESVTAIVRIRPVLATEWSAGHTTAPSLCMTATTSCVTMPAPRANSPAAVFSFNAVYGPRQSPQGIHETHIAPLVASFLQGYNATVLAFGQTGSGKTYTMLEVIPMALADIFHGMSATDSVSITHLEVYNEMLNDLLHPMPRTDSAIVIRGDTENRNIVISGLQTEEVRSAEEALERFKKGNGGRVTATTAMNEVSSRSHSIFTVYLHRDGGGGVTSKFHFVDLAGSERNKRTQNVGLRFKESVGINSGLLALQNVLRALSRNPTAVGHVPYRQSKLTRLLQDSLGGNSRTVFIGCVAPTHVNADETLRTLQYTAQAMCIKNRPEPNVDEANQTLVEDPRPPTDDLTPVVEQQKNQILELESQLRRANLNLQKDEVIFTQKLKEIRQLKKENVQLKRQISDQVRPVGTGLQVCNAMLAEQFENCLDVVLPFCPLSPRLRGNDVSVRVSMDCTKCVDLRTEMAYYKHTVNILRQQMKTLITEHDRLLSIPNHRIS